MRFHRIRQPSRLSVIFTSRIIISVFGILFVTVILINVFLVSDTVEAEVRKLDQSKALKVQTKRAEAIIALKLKLDQSKALKEQTKEAKAIIAYAVSLTACGPFLTEGAAVLKHSIHLASHPHNRDSNYAYKMYLFAHPSTKGCLDPFRTLGYNILIKETPINVAYIAGNFLRERVVKTGCCGEKEFLKLYAYTLTEHRIVVHLDLDSLILQPLDDLFDGMLVEEGGKRPDLPVMFGKPVPEKIDAYFTRGYDIVHSRHKNVGIQGGFLAVRPNLKYFQEYREIILKGDFKEHNGWAGKHGGFYGAQQIQGLSSYFYDGLHPGTAVELDRCIYNSVVDPPSGRRLCIDGTKTCDDCRQTDFSRIKSAHFTHCAKPWTCPVIKLGMPLCQKFHYKWFSVRKDLEEGMGLHGKNTGNYYSSFLGYCKGGGERNYIPLEINARHYAKILDTM